MGPYSPPLDEAGKRTRWLEQLGDGRHSRRREPGGRRRIARQRTRDDRSSIDEGPADLAKYELRECAKRLRFGDRQCRIRDGPAGGPLLRALRWVAAGGPVLRCCDGCQSDG